MLDHDAKGNLVGIDIDNANKKVQLKQLILNKIPGKSRRYPLRQITLPAGTIAGPLIRFASDRQTVSGER